MAAPQGNQNAKGNKGGGRKTKYAELATMATLADMYFNPQSYEKLERRVHSGKFSIQDRHALNALEGDQRAIDSITKKLFPDKQELSGSEGQPIDLNVGLKNTIGKIYGSGGGPGKNGV